MPKQQNYELHPQWITPDLDSSVRVKCTDEQTAFVFRFDVDESIDCFCLNYHHDGGNCWEDSCVEVFLQAGHDHDVYYNFECNAAGCILAEVGTSRAGRRRFTESEYANLTRHAEIVHRDEKRIHWQFELQIPKALLQVEDADSLVGNLYKCADKAVCKHYMTAHQVGTEKPDFHAPAYFKKLFC